MSDLFEISLRAKSAEQLLNMHQNKSAWSEWQYQKIKDEISKRGLEIFEEPEPWEDGLLENIDYLNPQGGFESDLAEIIAIDNKDKESKTIKLVSQIVSISSIFVVFCSVFILDINVIVSTFSFLLGFASFGTFVGRVYLVSLILGVLSLLITVVGLVIDIAQFY